ncbi:MAG: hypothetical protein IMZ52_09565, partial [Actinobacteria bacterium]|nr:hypothetical protein [Actinomycetota bacterium]
ELIYGGLSVEQAEEMEVPVNFEKPGSYQWEALTDKNAKDIIIPLVSKYQDKSKLKAAREKEKQLIKELKE